MKILKALLKIIAVIIVLFLIVSAFMPKTYNVERSIVINAPVEKVFAEANDFSNMDHWSPWKDYDPNAKKIVEGNVGESGYKYSWASDSEKVGHGSLTRVTTEANKSIVDDLHFDDWDMTSKAHWNFEQTDEGVKVTWGNSGDIGYIWRIPMKMMNMEKMMSPDFEKGLMRMKDYCETNAKAETAAAVTMPADSTSMNK